MVHYLHTTRAGTFGIRLHAQGWMLELDDDVLDGPYRTPQHAVDEVAAGHCRWPSSGDTSGLGIPDDLDDWRKAL